MIEYRWAEGHTERFAEIAAEFVRLKVDVIVTMRTAAALAAKQATSVIPIVFAVASDPVGTGLVASLSRPGGNVTGLSLQQPDTRGQTSRTPARDRAWSSSLAIMANVGYPAAVVEMGEVQKAARILGFESCQGNPTSRGYCSCLRRRSGAGQTRFMSRRDPLVNANRVRINTLALAALACRRCHDTVNSSKPEA